MRRRASSRSMGRGVTCPLRSSEDGARVPEAGQAAMIVVADMGPLHYLVLIGAEHILPQLFTRVFTPPAVLAEMSHPNTPDQVREWAASPPSWLEIKEPAHIEDIPSLGTKGLRGAGEKAALALAQEVRAEAILMDDRTGRREAKTRNIEPLWMLSVLDEAAEQRLVTDLSQKLVYLEQKTTFYVSRDCKRIIEGMKRRDLERKRTQGREVAPRKGRHPCQIGVHLVKRWLIQRS